MQIAVTSQNFRTVTGHAGRARRFIVFEADEHTPAHEVERLDLDAHMAMHGYDQQAAHPLDHMKVLITGGAGEGFVRHLASRGIQVVATDESVPELAVAAFLAGRFKSATGACHHDHCDDPADAHEHHHGCSCHSQA